MDEPARVVSRDAQPVESQVAFDTSMTSIRYLLAARPAKVRQSSSYSRCRHFATFTLDAFPSGKQRPGRHEAVKSIQHHP